MFTKQKKGSDAMAKTTNTVIGEGIIIENAEIKGVGNVRIDGKFSGNIELEGHIIVGESGNVRGSITANSGLLAGEFSGELMIENTVHLAPNSKVTGEIKSNKIIIDEDAVFNGKCDMYKENESVYRGNENITRNDEDVKILEETESIDDNEDGDEYFIYEKEKKII